jgi:F-type H+-transporting ATPase subunit b
MNFSWWTFALQVGNFLILVWLLQRFLFKPVRAIVARRKAEVSHALEEASAEKKGAEQLQRELETARSVLSAERQKILDETRVQLSAERQKIIEEAQREAKRVRDQALQHLDEERITASNKLYEQTIELATSLAQRLLQEIAATSVEQPFLGRVVDYLDQMPAEARAKLLPRNGGSSVLVTTAHPLDTRDQAEWREQLAKRLGGNLGVTFDIDPALIAGTVLTFPHAILNFNWRDSLALALKELHGNEHSH